MRPQVKVESENHNFTLLEMEIGHLYGMTIIESPLIVGVDPGYDDGLTDCTAYFQRKLAEAMCVPPHLLTAGTCWNSPLAMEHSNEFVRCNIYFDYKDS